MKDYDSIDMIDNQIEGERDEEGALYGDPRRCPRHPSVRTSSNDGMHDGLCHLCEGAMDDDEDTPLATRIMIETMRMNREMRANIVRMGREIVYDDGEMIITCPKPAPDAESGAPIVIDCKP